MIKQPEGLIEVLLDPSARVDERDDAAMDLAAYDDDAALEALAAVACDVSTPEMVLDSSGESIAEIWIRRSLVDEKLLARMMPMARYAAIQRLPREA